MGDILDCYKISGYIPSIIILLIRCVIWGLILLFISLYILIDELSWPILLEDFIYFISFLVCFMVIKGKLNLHFGLSISVFKIWIWSTLHLVKLFLILTTLLMKCSLAILAICLSDDITLLLWVIFLGGDLVHVLVISLTVVHSLLLLLISGFIKLLLFWFFSLSLFVFLFVIISFLV